MKRLILGLALFPALALAQTVPNGGIQQGQVWSVPQWVSAWQSKVDATNGTLSSPTLTSPTVSNTLTISGAAQAPIANVPNGSVGLGAIFNRTQRTGGFGQYGNDLFDYLVTAATPAAQFDTGLTSWATHTNLTGGQLFGSWAGANTPAFYTGEIYSGGAAIGHEINVGNRWADFGLQGDVGGTRYAVGLQLVPDLVPTTDTAQTAVTVTGAASPCVVNWTANALPLNTPVVFNGSGTLPAALTLGTTYYVNTPATNTFQLAASVNGAAITCATGSSGAINAIPYFPSTFGAVIGASVHNAKWWTGWLQRADTIMPGGHSFWINGGSAANGNVPQDAFNMAGFWVNGIDLSAATFSGPAIKTSNFNTQTFGQALTVNGNANFYTAQFNGSATVGQSLGVNIQSGTNASDFSLYITNQAGTQQHFLVRGDGGVLVGSPTGGDKGLGAVNAQTIYSQGSQIFPVLTGTSATITPGALVANTCNTATTTAVTGATTAMSVVATPVTYPGDMVSWPAWVSSANTISIKVCSTTAQTPTPSAYNIRVLQ